jgi:hypothetical protein
MDDVDYEISVCTSLSLSLPFPLTFEQNLFHTSSLRRTVPFAMTKLILAFTKAQRDAIRDFLQQRRLVAAILLAYLEDFVGQLLLLLADLHRIEQNVASLGPRLMREGRNLRLVGRANINGHLRFKKISAAFITKQKNRS